MLVALALLAAAPAASPWYQVEVVVFSQGGDAAWQRGNWREEGPPSLAKNTVELLVGPEPTTDSAGRARRHAFRTLPATALDLGAAVDRLERTGEYRVMLHVGWRQPGFPIDEAPGVHLSTPRGIGSQAGLTANDKAGIDGTVRLWRRRFLHVDADIAFGDIEGWKKRTSVQSEPSDKRNDPARTAVEPGGSGDAGARAPDASRTEAQVGGSTPLEGGDASGAGPESAARDRLRVARMTRSLRLREGRLHYVDHPLFGVLLLVKRLN